jgi:hypothetical protein
MITPQEIMGRLLLAGNLEARHGAALRVHETQYVIDGAVLARDVASLQADEQRTLGTSRTRPFWQRGVRRVVNAGNVVLP